MKLIISLLSYLTFYTLGLVIATSEIASAQINPDNTVNTQVNQNGNVAEIIGGETRGDNLFHSFQNFSVDTSSEAFFNNAANIDNIVSRVTGGNISRIDGAIRANGSANLFLVNPAGIIFGAEASLNIGGSFYGSSANSILFPDGVEFSATDTQLEPVLTINAPIGLGFRDSPGNIVNLSAGDGSLLINQDESISLLGGNVSLENGGTILAAGARVNLGGLLESGTIDINEDGSLSFPANVPRGNVSLSNSSGILLSSAAGGSLNVEAKNFELTTGSFILGGIDAGLGNPNAQAGDITINTTEDVVIDASDNQDLTTISNNSFGVGNSGNIAINARNISLMNGGSINSFSSGLGSTGDIALTATDNISFDGATQNQISGIQNSLSFSPDDNTGNTQSTGIIGTTNVTAKNFDLTNGARISSLNSGTGNSGNININITDNLNIDGDGAIGSEESLLNSGIFSSVIGSVGANSGDINISAQALALTNGGAVSTDSFGRGNAGDINITTKTTIVDGLGTPQASIDNSGQVSPLVNSSTISSNVLASLKSTTVNSEAISQGSGGSIALNTNLLSITNGGKISTDITGIGKAGDINIVADKINVDGQGFLDLVDSNGQISPLGIVSSISSEATGGLDGEIISPVFSQGNGGNINIDANSLSLTNGGSVTGDVSNAIGDGGNITINAADNILVQGAGSSTFRGETVDLSSEISSLLSLGGVGTGGSIDINTSRLSVREGATIDTSTLGEGNAGNLRIHATNSLEVSSDGLITSNVGLDTTGNGGDVNIRTGDLTLVDNASINATNRGFGNAGNININARSINLNEASSIAATTRTGNGGNITLSVAENITLLNNNNFISARALNNANGGNINIEANFIVALPSQNNDFLATANQGDGGNININAQALFGIKEQATSTEILSNDISASSEVSGLDGSIDISTSGINPLQGATELPKNIVEPEKTSSQICNANRELAAQNGLNIRGKGGIPAAPGLPLSSAKISINGQTSETINYAAQGYNPINTAQGSVVPARGIEIANDQVILTAYSTGKDISGVQKGFANCGKF